MPGFPICRGICIDFFNDDLRIAALSLDQGDLIMTQYFSLEIHVYRIMVRKIFMSIQCYFTSFTEQPLLINLRFHETSYFLTSEQCEITAFFQMSTPGLNCKMRQSNHLSSESFIEYTIQQTYQEA